ncbi:MAG: hypothetical protein ABSF18_06925 [Gammaproteobacteria bacterium]
MTGFNVLNMFVLAAFNTAANDKHADQRKVKFYQLMIKFLNDEKLEPRDVDDFNSLNLPKDPVSIKLWLPQAIVRKVTIFPIVATLALTKLPEWIKENSPKKENSLENEYVLIDKPNPEDTGMFRSVSSSSLSAQSSEPTDFIQASSEIKISSERQELIKVIKSKLTSSLRFIESDIDRTFKDECYNYLITALRDSNKKISVIRQKVIIVNGQGKDIRDMEDSGLTSLLNDIQEKEENTKKTALKKAQADREVIIKDMGLIVLEIYRLSALNKKCDEKIIKSLIVNFAIFHFLQTVLLKNYNDSNEVILTSIENELKEKLDPSSPKRVLNIISQNSNILVTENTLTVYLACQEVKTQDTCLPEGISQTTMDLVTPEKIADRLKATHAVKTYIIDEQNEWNNAVTQAIKDTKSQIRWLKVNLIFHDIFIAIFGGQLNSRSQRVFDADGMILRRKIAVLTEFKDMLEDFDLNKQTQSVAKTSLNKWALQLTASGLRKNSLDAKISVLEKHRDKSMEKSGVETDSALIVKKLILGPVRKPSH